MELWGGHECTVNRLHDVYRDQTQLTGHQDRFADLARFASLGIKCLRYPVLWERIAPDHPDARDWNWSDQRLAEIDRLGMRPIAGLLHHGSGPRYTSLVADNFVTLFADYAAAAAAQYPWIDDWTPINEPLTTARFSALYGHWYPHATDERSFWTALLNQIDGTRMAMKAVRRLNAAARLVQTEDLGQTYSTPALIEMAAYNNHRRWLTWDLLTGRVTRNHALWARIDALGFGDRARAIADDPCPPDIIGVNYYITGERFLDHRLNQYPYPISAEGHHDVTAARVLDPAPVGLGGLLQQTWDRYRLPVAVTESHLGCTRDEQLRWLQESWHTCLRLRDDGVDVRAMTAWALLGNVDWNSLLTVDAGHYEPGAFDVRREPRETAIAKLLRTLGGLSETPSVHPVLDVPGWWQRQIRFEHEPYVWSHIRPIAAEQRACRPILITGANGALAEALTGACGARGLAYVMIRGVVGDDADQVRQCLDRHKPWAVIDAARWVPGDNARQAPTTSIEGNLATSIILAAACADQAIHYTMFSLDIASDELAGPRYDHTQLRPVGAYGQSRTDIEAEVSRAGGRALIIRHWQGPAGSGDATFLPRLVNATLDLVIDDEAGIWQATDGSGDLEPVPAAPRGSVASACSAASTSGRRVGGR